MPELVKIRSELFPKLYAAFLHDDDPLSDQRDWRDVFDYQWQKDEDYSGYALLENDKVIGMMAMAFSNRLIDGQSHKFCNLHTWWVHEDHRGHSVAMLRPLLSLTDYTITHFTPCDRIRALTKRLGFVDLNLQTKVLLPLQVFGRVRTMGNAQFIFDDSIDRTMLAEHDLQVFRDHQPYRVGNLVVRDGDQYCYLLYTYVERYRVRYCHVHYISNKEIFVRHEHAIRTRLMRKHGVRFVILDLRSVQNMKFARSFNFWAPAHAVYRPAGNISQDQVDNLYSDVVMLGLAILPHVRHEIEEFGRRWLP